MSRVRKRGRSRRSRNGGGNSSDKKTWLLAILIVGIPALFIVFGWIWLRWSAFQYEYDIDLCLKNRPLANHTVLLIDSTDTLGENKLDYLERLIDKTKAELEPFAKFSIFTIDFRRGGYPMKVFSLCNPGTAEATNIFTQAPSHVQEKFEKEFLKPLEAVKQGLSIGRASKQSPILETLLAISEMNEFGISLARRTLVIYSDMMQNTNQFSQYSKDWQRQADQVMRKFPAELKNVELSVHYIINEPGLQNSDHRAFWRNYFTSRGANYKFFLTR
jgi:hypothetical protein